MSPSDPCPSPFRAPIGATGGLGHGSRLSPRRGWKRLLLTCLRVLGLTNKLHIGRKPLWPKGFTCTRHISIGALGLWPICNLYLCSGSARSRRQASSSPLRRAASSAAKASTPCGDQLIPWCLQRPDTAQALYFSTRVLAIYNPARCRCW